MNFPFSFFSFQIIVKIQIKKFAFLLYEFHFSPQYQISISIEEIPFLLQK